jgi:hypothetical protein
MLGSIFRKQASPRYVTSAWFHGSSIARSIS